METEEIIEAFITLIKHPKSHKEGFKQMVMAGLGHGWRNVSLQKDGKEVKLTLETNPAGNYLYDSTRAEQFYINNAMAEELAKEYDDKPQSIPANNYKELI